MGAEAEAEAAQVGSDSDAEDRPPQKRARADSDASDEDEWADFVLEDNSDDSDSDEGVDIADAVVVDPSILEGYAAKKKLSRMAALQRQGNKRVKRGRR